MNTRHILTILLASAVWVGMILDASGQSLQSEASSAAGRQRSARQLLAEFTRLAELLPNPSPSERAWVESEEQSMRGIADSKALESRRLQFYNAPEFQQLKLYEHTKELRSALKCIIDSPSTTQREVFCWAAAAFLLGDRSVFADGVRVLRQAKRLPQNIGGVTSDDGLAQLYGILSRNIQEYIVLPYLRGTLK